ncbi:hypothetical protein AAVH_25262, partial [Aphelenchoides avenae]
CCRYVKNRWTRKSRRPLRRLRAQRRQRVERMRTTRLRQGSETTNGIQPTRRPSERTPSARGRTMNHRWRTHWTGTSPRHRQAMEKLLTPPHLLR